MNICLIIPPSPFLLDEKVFVNLGILKVASSLQQYGHNVKVIDLTNDTSYLWTLSTKLKDNLPDVVGITSTTQQFPFVCRINKQIRQEYPNLKQIIGGVHSTLVYSSLKQKQERSEKNWKELQSRFDVIVSGDGEFAVMEALNMKQKGVIDADKTNSPLFLTNEKFNSSPFPSRNLIDMDSYHYYINGKRATSLIAQLGCPFSCGFCSGRTSNMLRKIRLRTCDSVIDEIKFINCFYGYNGFMFYDDELNVNPSMINLLKKLIKLRDQYDFSYRGCIKAELFTEEQAYMMSLAGFDEILVGFESGNDQILRNINKKATKSDNERCIYLAKTYGIKIKYLMSIGHPGESPKTCQDSLDWLLKMKPDQFNVTIITCTPGMFYYDHAIKTCQGWMYTCPSGDKIYSQDIDYTEISDYYNGALGEYNSFIHTDFLSSHDLVLWRDHIEFTVRSKVGIPYPTKTEMIFDKTMGQ